MNSIIHVIVHITKVYAYLLVEIIRMKAFLLASFAVHFVLKVSVVGTFNIFQHYSSCLDAGSGCGASGTTLAITNEDDLASINGCTTIFGSLYIQAQGDVDVLRLPPSLVIVTGGLFCTGTGLNYSTTTIEADGLSGIGSDENDTSIQEIGLVISDYTQLTTLNFPRLTGIGSNFVLARNPLLRGSLSSE